MRRLVAALLLLAPAARARPPGGHVYFGAGGELLVSRFGGGPGISVEAQVELWRFFLGGSVLFSTLERSDLPRQGLFWAGPRAGYFFTDDPLLTAYASLGFGRMEQGQVLFDDTAVSWALAPELGAAFARSNQFGHFSVAVHALLPLHRNVDRQNGRFNALDDWFGLVFRALL